MGAGSAFAELLLEFGLEGRRNGVLQPLGFFVNLVPLHAEDFTQHALDEMVAKRGAIGGFAARRR